MNSPFAVNNNALAMDAQALSQLRNQAKNSPDEALKKAAQQFEAVFLDMMLKSMRQATPQEGISDSEQTKMFTGMLDQQLAQSMAKKGIGLADSMVRQLSRHSTAPLSPDNKAVSAAPLSAIPTPYNQNVQQGFVDRMTPHAMKASQASGVPPQLMLGQAALESGWGKREIRNADGSNSHNVFGIKAGAGWQGKVASIVTTEYQDGKPHTQRADFRAYNSYSEAFQDYAKMLSNNPRYNAVLQQGGDAVGMAQTMQQGGYATDPHYAEKLARVMNSVDIAGASIKG